MKPIIEVENLCKLYHLGTVGASTMRESFDRWWCKWRGKEHPHPIGHRHLMIDPKDPQAGPEPDTIWALKDVSFSVGQGEIVGLIGRNGAGKSTLLKILSKITEPTSGRAILRGRVSSLLEVGTGFHPELTGRKNIYLNGAILGMRKAEIDCKFDEIVAFSEVEKFIDTPVKHYSSGMYVRLAFAVAAHLEPEILFVDEVLAVGDVAFQKKCLGKISKVAQEGRTILFVSHSMSAIELLCSQCILIEKGLLTAVGNSRDVIELYLNKIQSVDYRKQTPADGMILQILTKDIAGLERDIFEAGEPIRVVLNIDTRSDEIKTPVIGIGFNTIYGQRIFTVGTYFSTSELPPICSKVSVVCDIPFPSLAPGDYFLKVTLGRSSYENFEVIEDAVHIHIAPSDFYGTGRFPSASQGFVLVRSNWWVQPE